MGQLKGDISAASELCQQLADDVERKEQPDWVGWQGLKAIALVEHLAPGRAADHGDEGGRDGSVPWSCAGKTCGQVLIANSLTVPALASLLAVFLKELSTAATPQLKPVRSCRAGSKGSMTQRWPLNATRPCVDAAGSAGRLVGSLHREGGVVEPSQSGSPLDGGLDPRLGVATPCGGGRPSASAAFVQILHRQYRRSDALKSGIT